MRRVRWWCITLAATAIAIAAQGQPRDPAVDTARIEREHKAIVEQTQRTLNQVRQGVLRDVERMRATARDVAVDLELPATRERLDREAKRSKLQADVRFWLSGQTAYLVDSYEINYAIADALEIARADGLDVAKLRQLYEHMKRVVRSARFEDPQVGPPPDEDERLSAYFSRLFTFAHNAEVEANQYRARLTTYRQGLFKKVGAAYVRALISGRDPRPPCDVRGGTRRVIKLGGQDVRVFGCPDPVVEYLRGYAQALRTIQSAEVDTAAAQVDLLVAEQQLAADVLSGVPLVGEAIDIYAVFAGENLAGQPLSAGERAVMTLFITVPIVGPAIFEQVCRRSPAAADAVARIAAYTETLIEGSQWYARELSTGMQEIYLDMASRTLGAENTDALLRAAVTKLDDARALAQRVLKALADDPEYVHPGRDQWFIHQKLRQAAQDKIDFEALPREYRERVVADATRTFQETLGAAQAGLTREQRIARSGIVPTHAEAISHVARQRNEIQIMRYVNPDAAPRIADDAATKWMGLKSKSTSEPIIAGFIPVEQSLNKTGTEMRKAQAELRRARAGSDRAAIEAAEKKLAEAQYQVAKGWEAVEACRKKGCAREVPYLKDGKPLHHTMRPGTDQLVMVIEDGRGGWMDAVTGKRIDFAPQAPPKVVHVYATEDGRLVTADYDVFAFGDRKKRQQPAYNPQTGYTTPRHNDAIDDINRAVQGKDPGFDIGAHGGKPYEGGNVVHHGAEENFFGSPGMEDPWVTAFEPNGNIIQIPQCDRACMQNWCRAPGPDGRRRCDPARVCAAPGPAVKCIGIDRERLAKDYFHLMRSLDWNLDPNPGWKWGQYNALGGWLPPYTELSLGTGTATRSAVR